ncbi:hypothetical protein FAM6165_02776 [Lacticaseibacillus paracasei]|uniref:hypothetical protein n=1 Tax=Lacticaseibacillus paracasei TaxID=1597 RepID=UPI000FED7E6A|nr:hypothetical protein [Lacticaseibacillus paracasei]RNE25116.1 hypothetical protein FAM6165_02776 [Lacticaseibacillus paracasei]
MKNKYKDLEKEVGQDPKLVKSLKSFLENELSCVRFLIKDQRYAYEHEIRLLQLTPSFEHANYDINNSKLYMNYRNYCDSDGNKITLQINEIIFGIDSDRPSLWSAMVEKKLGKQVALSKTGIHYRSN